MIIPKTSGRPASSDCGLEPAVGDHVAVTLSFARHRRIVHRRVTLVVGGGRMEKVFDPALSGWSRGRRGRDAADG
jgi:hypothetical protein